MNQRTEVLYPILLLPKNCTTLETNCELTDNVFIDVTITSPDTQGNNACIYSGFCNIKLIDSYDMDVQDSKSIEELQVDSEDDLPVVITDQQVPRTQSEVWIDPKRSPHVYNHYGMSESQESYSVCHQSSTSITVEQRNTYITKYNYKEAIQYSTHEEVEKKPRNVGVEQQTSEANHEYDDFEWGVFLSQLPEEIVNDQNRAQEERKFIGLQSEDSALKQLMSPGIQSMTKQRKTILYLGPDAHCGQTIQQIAYYDPSVKCSGGPDVDNEVVIEGSESPNQKRYQCAKCQQIFDQISDFREHMVGHSSPRPARPARPRAPRAGPRYTCDDCGKTLKTREKYEKHCLGHGNPELECNHCRKVFASKFTLRTHRKRHARSPARARSPRSPRRCTRRTRLRSPSPRARAEPAHLDVEPADLDVGPADLDAELEAHLADSSSTEFADSLFDDVLSSEDALDADPAWQLDDEVAARYQLLQQGPGGSSSTSRSTSTDTEHADSVIAKVMSNEMFMADSPKKHKRYRKVCDVCYKTFDRVSDLKRHLIEHVVRSTLAKSPVSRAGTLSIRCEVCHRDTFSRVDRYKAHLREHAKLTLYQCTFCNKSFSDSSNFSKHKKIHAATYFQCDLCQRKFNSKKMITVHMKYHKEHAPLPCRQCDKTFHFQSTLNKHVKYAHTERVSSKFRCKFCYEYFKSLKDKWDHEWTAHNVRKMIVDCLLCGAQFRKYAELKRHCLDHHNVEIPTAKKLLRKKNRAGLL